MMRLVVTGGRQFNNMTMMHMGMLQVCERMHDYIDVVIHGDATGADKLADAWCMFQGIPTEKFPARWSEIHLPGARVRVGRHGAYNVLAGMWRNQQMIDEGKPDAWLAMPGGTGTADMVTRCRAAGLPGIEVFG
jgi:hypothetical protein